MATNDQVAVNPPVPITVFKLRVWGCISVVYITHYVIRIKKHLHNQIEIIEIERQ